MVLQNLACKLPPQPIGKRALCYLYDMADTLSLDDCDVESFPINTINTARDSEPAD